MVRSLVQQPVNLVRRGVQAHDLSRNTLLAHQASPSLMLKDEFHLRQPHQLDDPAS